MYSLRKMNKKDLAAVSAILAGARKHMGEVLRIDQWQGAYPSAADFEADITIGRAYVFCDERDFPIGVAMVTTEHEPIYDRIADETALARIEKAERFAALCGKWHFDANDAGVVHRFCVDTSLHRRGVGSAFMREICVLLRSKSCKSVRIDTHPLNIPMQKMLEKSGFCPVGVVTVPEKTPERIAYEKAL